MNNVPVTFSQLCCHLKRICTTVLHASSTQVESWLYVVGELITHSPITATASLVLWPCRLVYSWKEIKNFAISMLLLYDWVFFFFKTSFIGPQGRISVFKHPEDLFEVVDVTMICSPIIMTFAGDMIQCIASIHPSMKTHWSFHHGHTGNGVTLDSNVIGQSLSSVFA